MQKQDWDTEVASVKILAGVKIEASEILRDAVKTLANDNTEAARLDYFVFRNLNSALKT